MGIVDVFADGNDIGSFNLVNVAPTFTLSDRQLFTTSFVATGTTSTVRFGNSQDANQHFTLIDSASVTVPEPTTWVLLIGGFAMTGVAVRRRRRSVAA